MIARAGSAALLASPFALALVQGGYFDEARLWAAVGMWILVAVAAPVPRSRPALAAVAGLGGLVVWTLVSFAWAPLRAPAVDDAQRLALYLGALLAATALLRGGAARAAVPVLAAGIVATAVYGLSERLLPGLFELARSQAAMGRLNQPLTYWNAMGAWAAIGLVLCARLAGEPGRPAWLRAAAAAGAAPLGAALALTFSRGAIAAAVIGVGVLAALEPRPAALRAPAGAVAAAVATGVLAAALPAVRTLEGARESEGLVLLAALVVAGVAAALVVRRASAVDDAAADRRTAAVDDAAGRQAPAADAAAGRRARRLVVIATVAGAVLLAAAAAAVEGEPDEGASATRLSSAASNRYAYWEVALSAFRAEPLHGGGSGSFAVDWLRERDVNEVVRDAHSLELETAGELGLVGLALLGLLVGGVAAGAAAALRRDRVTAVAPVAGLAVWAAHSALDWDWEMPALTLVAVLLAGMLLAGDAPRPGRGVRALVSLGAVAIAAGLAVELRSATLVAAARDVSGTPQAFDKLERAGELSLDTTSPRLDRARMLLFARREREAAAVADDIVRDEPENAFAWELVRVANAREDPARAREAERRLRALVRRVP